MLETRTTFLNPFARKLVSHLPARSNARGEERFELNFYLAPCFSIHQVRLSNMGTKYEEKKYLIYIHNKICISPARPPPHQQIPKYNILNVIRYTIIY